MLTLSKLAGYNIEIQSENHTHRGLSGIAAIFRNTGLDPSIMNQPLPFMEGAQSIAWCREVSLLISGL
jgi:hypothetical protein